jgi:hypothetical protein
MDGVGCIYLRRYRKRAGAGSRNPDALPHQTPISSGTGNLQDLAIETALARRFVVISGGPGTGNEASMVSLTMMAKLFDPLPKKARVILLGDRDQLRRVSPRSAGVVNFFPLSSQGRSWAISLTARPKLAPCAAALSRYKRITGSATVQHGTERKSGLRNSFSEPLLVEMFNAVRLA